MDSSKDPGIREENRKVRRLRLLVDLSLDYIRNRDVTHDDAIRIVEEVRNHALTLFPGKEGAFDMIYAPRFKRMLNTKFRRS